MHKGGMLMQHMQAGGAQAGVGGKRLCAFKPRSALPGLQPAVHA